MPAAAKGKGKKPAATKAKATVKAKAPTAGTATKAAAKRAGGAKAGAKAGAGDAKGKRGLHMSVKFSPDSPTVSHASDAVLRGTMAAGRTMMLVHSPGCGWCMRLRPAWEQAKGEALSRGVHVVELESDALRSSSPCGLHGLLDRSDYSGGVPHIVMVVPTLRRGAPAVEQYEGPRTPDDLVRFALGQPRVAPPAATSGFLLH